MKIILVFLAVLFVASVCTADDYGKGYQDGYKRGYQYQEKGGIEPIAPIPPILPIPKIGESGYDDGYRRGVIKGHEESLQKTKKLY